MLQKIKKLEYLRDSIAIYDAIDIGDFTSAIQLIENRIFEWW